MTDIAPNQPIRLNFSKPVNPDTVDFSTISLKTSSGRTPQGRFVVTGHVVEFRPEIRIVGGQTSFGFLANETYLLNLPDASESGQVLRSVSGDSLSEPLVCSLRVSQKIVDLDQSPPQAKLITPTDTENVDKRTLIVLEFSELIDIAPFLGSTTETSPVQYLIRKTVAKPNGAANERVCDQNFPRPINVEGLPQAENDPNRGVTTITLRPTVPLPSQVCVEVVVTSAVHDLAGTPAVEQSFRFLTEVLVAGEAEIREPFLNDGQLDKTISSGRWSGGVALPPQIGGSGELGEFVAAAGTPDPNNPSRFIWNTDSMVIPGFYTPTGQDITVTGGVFEFTRFDLKAGIIVAFEGSNPATIRVRGEAIVNGSVTVNAPEVPYFPAVKTPGSPELLGQKGGLGGCGGAAGGQGGDACLNAGPDARFIGRTGSIVALPSGNGYSAEAAVTGGKGGPLFPATGITPLDSYCGLGAGFCSIVGVGGGGGGFSVRGTDSFVLEINGVPQNPCRKKEFSGSSSNIGGGIFDLGALTNGSTSRTASFDFYSVGGSGGGGGTSHPLLSRGGSYARWLPGSGGAGGGGVLRLQVGTSLTMLGGVLQAKGGEGYFIDSAGTEPSENLFNVPTPGGGGSGGSILVQVFGKANMSGTLDTSGGKGGELDTRASQQSGLLARGYGGDGGAGYYRLETPGGASVVDVGAGIPAASAKNVGTLTDSQFDGVTLTKFYSTKLTFPPTFLRYEIEAEVNGARRVYSDDASLGDSSSPKYDKDYAGLAGETNPVWFEVQGAKVSSVTGEADLQTLTSWFDYVSSKTEPNLNGAEKATGIRFRMTFDTAAGSVDIKVKRVSVFYVE